MSELSSSAKKGKLTVSIISFMVLLVGACTWVLAKPKATQKAPITDFITWSAQQAAYDTELLVTIDSSRLPQKTITDDDVVKLQKALQNLREVFHFSIDFKQDLKAQELQWIVPQISLLGNFGGDDRAADLVLLMRSNNDEAAHNFFKNHFSSLPFKVDNGCAYIASTEAALERVTSAKKYTLATDVAFVDARQKVRYARNSFIYCDLSRQAPKIAANLNEALLRNFKDDSHKLHTADLVSLISSLRYIVGGEDNIDGRLQGECFLIADVANSGKLGEVVFNPNFNIAHPALAKRAASSQSCIATNLKYNYAILYELMGVHPFTEAVRDYPDYIFSAVDLSLNDDIFGALLTGSTVASIENFDYDKVIALTKKTVQQASTSNDGVKDDKSKAGTKATAQNDKLEANANGTTKNDNAKDDSKDEKVTVAKDGSVSISGPNTDLVNSFMDLLRSADWRVSFDLQDRATLEKMAANLPLFQQLLNGVFAKDGSAKNTASEADAERWGFLPASKVVDNTIWMASQAANCGPVADNLPTIGELGCWKTLDKMCVSHNAVCEWIVSNQALQAQHDFGKDAGIAGLTKMWNERGSRQCGRLTVMPDGLHFCEVMEVNPEK